MPAEPSPQQPPLFVQMEAGPAHHRLNMRAAFAILGVCVVVFTAITTVDILWADADWRALHGSANHARQFASAVSRAYNVILGMVISSIALAIPITANMYTPKLVEIFVRDRYTIGVIALFVFSCMHAMWGTFATWEGGRDGQGLWPRLNEYMLLFEMLLGFAIVPVYLYYVSGFLNPSIIIQKVSGVLLDELRSLERNARPVHEAQRHVAQRIQNLGNVILRAVDRADRDVALEAIRSLEHVLFTYASIKPRLRPEWFTVGGDILIGFSRDAIEFVNKDRTWVEHRCMTQLALAYNASLAKMPDAVSAISVVASDIALHAEQSGDGPELQLCIRFFNTFIREAVKKRDVHAIYDIFSHYKSLIRALMSAHPELLVDGARYFRYYADFARNTGMPFIYELASYELGEVLEGAYDRGVPTRAQMLDVMLSLDGAAASPRLVKSRAILWSFFTGRTLAPEAERTRAALRGLPVGTLEIARNDLLGTTEKVFFEVTDRQSNFDYVDDGRKTLIRELLDGLIREASAGPPARAA
jgi:hypothetical protein